jgi:hypothetical protein
MKTNVGKTDRILRIALAVVLFYLAFFSGMPSFASPLLKYGAVVVGIVMLATSVLRTCPIYSVLGIKTCKDC